MSDLAALIAERRTVAEAAHRPARPGNGNGNGNDNGMTPVGPAGDDNLTEAEARDLLLIEAASRFRGLARADLDSLPPPTPLIADMLPATGLALCAGSRGLGKTLLAMDWAAHVATDLPLWYGKEVAVHGPVLYVGLEGFHGIPNRLRAWEAVNHRRVENVTWVREPVDLKRSDDAGLLGVYAAGLGAVLVVIDSARAAGSGKEDTNDMGAFVRGLEAVQRTAGGLVLVLHNSGWNEERERGSTLLPDACDTTLILRGDPQGLRNLTHRKHRDGDMLDTPLGFAFRKVDDTRSGVLVSAELPEGGPILPDLLVTAIRSDPGKATGYYADLLGRHRPNVSTALAELALTGAVRNDGTKQRPSWVVPAERTFT
ncbi:MAG: AAA family ATPase [Actinomycetes bacterium]